MLQEERFEKILGQLKTKGAVKVSDLAPQFKISESTIRRDINDLDSMGKLQKVFGGAADNSMNINIIDTDMETKSSVHVEEKNEVARYAATLINDNDFVFIDAGSTTAMMIDYLENKSVTYVTNGISHGQKLAHRGFKVFITGGHLKPSTEAIVGTETISFLSKCNFTKCFIGVNGIDKNRGFTTPDLDESLVKTEAMKKAYMTYVLADNSKFGCVSSVSFGDMSKACIITDKLEDDTFKKFTIIKEVAEKQ